MINLQRKIRNREAKIGIIGLGHIGLPLSLMFAEERFSVTGIDINKEKVERIRNSHSPISDIPPKKLRKFIGNNSLQVTDDYSVLSKMDVIIICVPTPLKAKRIPDLDPIEGAIEQLKEYVHKGQLIILESTVYPGFTEKTLISVLQGGGMRIGKDIFVAYSPNRINPADKNHPLRKIPKVISGTTLNCKNLTKSLYSMIFHEVVPASSTTIAEMSKLWENIYRFINISLANETAQICDGMGIDFWEVCELASTKPFGFEKYSPGPGIGGHCISIDPHYFSWAASEQRFETKFIAHAAKITKRTPKYVVSKTVEVLKAKKRNIRGANILLLGVAYKENVNDVRTSPALDIIGNLKHIEADVSYYDPYVPILKGKGFTLKSVDSKPNLLKGLDCIIIVTAHKEFEALYPKIIATGLPIIDTRNALCIYNAENIVHLYSGAKPSRK